MSPRRIAVIDIGKTNVKLALVDGETLGEIAVETRPNQVLPGPPWPHFDLEGHWEFLLGAMTRMHAEHGIDAISVTTHGASAVLLQADGTLAAPMLDYEHPGPDETSGAYDAIRPPFDETGSPRLPLGLNLGAQLHWQFTRDPDLDARTAHVLTYPQYWGYRLTGELATDVTSLGCHTDLWNPWEGAPSSLVGRLQLTDRLAPARRSSDILGRLAPEIAERTGMAPSTPVAVGIHDSNASLYPHLTRQERPFSVVSTGTWVIAMAVGGRPTRLDPARDTLANVDATGSPVPSARFMGGREYDRLGGTADILPTPEDRTAVLSGLFCLPTTETGTGPYPAHSGGFTAEPGTPGQRQLAISWYLALMTDTCLSLIGAEGPVIIEGPFARNPDFLDMLATLRGTVEASTSTTGTSVGAALLASGRSFETDGGTVRRGSSRDLQAYAEAWRNRLSK